MPAVTRNLGNIVMDVNDVEVVDVIALGGTDNLTVSDLTGTDVVKVDGGANEDTILGSQGSDVFLGGTGNDFVFGDNGNDVSFMGADDDVFQWDRVTATTHSRVRTASTRCSSSGPTLPRTSTSSPTAAVSSSSATSPTGMSDPGR